MNTSTHVTFPKITETLNITACVANVWHAGVWTVVLRIKYS